MIGGIIAVVSVFAVFWLSRRKHVDNRTSRFVRVVSNSIDYRREP